jgi:LCP family protein required for cell wall assembly
MYFLLLRVHFPNEEIVSVFMKTKTIKAILIGIVVVAVIVLALVLASKVENRLDVAPEGAGTAASFTTVREEEEDEEAVSPLEDTSETVSTIYYDGKTYQKNENISTLLILGIDDYELEETNSFRNNGQADFLLLAIFDNENKTCTLLQLNRDTMCDVPVLGIQGSVIGLTTEQLALAHTYGSGLEDSGENTVEAVSRLLYDTPIDNYLALTMGAIPVLNDLVGGVTVTIEDDFSAMDDTLIQGETVTLTGEHALNYVRARYVMEDDTNLTRMRRQREYMTALVEQMQAKVQADPSFMLEVYGAVADYLVTDCAVDELSDYGAQLSDYTLSDILTLDGEAVLGEVYMEFYVDEAALQQQVVDLFYIPVDGE